MGLPVGGFNDEVGEVSSTFLFAGCFLFFTEKPGFPLCKAAVTMMDGFLQLVACWLAAQTGLFLCCFWGGGGTFTMFALLLFCHICTTFGRFRVAFLAYVSSSSVISLGCVLRDFLASSNSSVVSEAKLSIN